MDLAQEVQKDVFSVTLQGEDISKMIFPPSGLRHSMIMFQDKVPYFSILISSILFDLDCSSMMVSLFPIAL